MPPHADDHIRFDVPDGLTLRTQRIDELSVAVYRMNHPKIRMELSVLVGPFEGILKCATQTTISFFPPAGQQGPTDADFAMTAGLLLGAIKADSAVALGDHHDSLKVRREADLRTPRGLPFRELLYTAYEEPRCVMTYAAVGWHAPRARGILVGYLTHQDNFEAVDGFKNTVLASLELP